jgi:hypothetical protein
MHGNFYRIARDKNKIPFISIHVQYSFLSKILSKLMIYRSSMFRFDGEGVGGTQIMMKIITKFQPNFS